VQEKVMRKTVGFIAVLLGVGLYVGCDDGGPSDLTLADLVGSWIGDQFEFTNRDNRMVSVDFVAAGADVAMTVAGNGRYTAAAVEPVGGFTDVITGAMLVEEGYLLMTDDAQPGETIAFAAQLAAGVLTIFSNEVSYDFDVPPDGVEEPADLRAVFRFATGTTVADLVGTWEATEYRYVSSPTPADTIDVIELGGGVNITLDADGRYALAVTLPGELPEDQSGVLMISGDMIYMIDDVDPVDLLVFEYALDGETVTMQGEDSIDFDDPPDGIDDPAVVELVLVRQ
jgi:hypothetical protein